MNIVGPKLEREPEIQSILRSLPRWFGVEDSLRMYVRDSALKPTFGADLNGGLVGFVTLTEHFPESWEIHCMAISAAHRSKGVGSALLAHAEQYVRAQGARFLQVKTMAATSPSPEYAETRKFYLAKGFVPMEVFPTLWHPQHPALQLVKVLTSA